MNTLKHLQGLMRYWVPAALTCGGLIFSAGGAYYGVKEVLAGDYVEQRQWQERDPLPRKEFEAYEKLHAEQLETTRQELGRINESLQRLDAFIREHYYREHQ